LAISRHNDVPVPNALLPLLLFHDHAEQTVPSREPTVGATKLHITLNEGDVVEPERNTLD